MGWVEAERTDQDLPICCARPARAALDADRHGRGYRPAERPATCASRGREDRLHHALDPQFLRGAATGCGTCTGEMYMPGPGGAGDLRPLPAHRATTACSTPRSTRRSGASRRATTSSLAPAGRRPSSGTVGDRARAGVLRPSRGRRAGRPGAARRPRYRRAQGMARRESPCAARRIDPHRRQRRDDLADRRLGDDDEVAFLPPMSGG